MVKSQILLNSQFLFNFVDILFNRIFFHCCLHFPHDLSHVYPTNSLFFLISTKFSASSIHAHSLITCLLPLLEPLLMLMHLPTWDVLLPLIYYLCPTLLFGTLRLKFHLLFDFFFYSSSLHLFLLWNLVEFRVSATQLSASLFSSAFLSRANWRCQCPDSVITEPETLESDGLHVHWEEGQTRLYVVEKGQQ